MEIISHTYEEIIDPTGILEGKRYEFFLSIEIDEEDEIYSENGLFIRAIISELNREIKVAQAHFIERESDKVLDFSLEEDEMEMVQKYCQNKLN